jgi:hypothetical protein
MLTQPIPSTTQECLADQPQKLHAAGAGRGNGQRPPMCISYQEPGGSNQGQQEESYRIRTRIDHLLQAIDMPRCRVGCPVWEDEGCLPQPRLSQAQQLEQPSFVVAELCGRLIFTTQGDIYEAPRCMWLQTAVEGGAAWN